MLVGLRVLLIGMSLLGLLVLPLLLTDSYREASWPLMHGAAFAFLSQVRLRQRIFIRCKREGSERVETGGVQVESAGWERRLGSADWSAGGVYEAGRAN